MLVKNDADLQNLLRRGLQETLQHPQQRDIRILLDHQFIVLPLVLDVLVFLGLLRHDGVAQRVEIAQHRRQLED